MSNDDQKTLETESITSNNMGGHVVAVPGSTSGNNAEKRTLPLLYVQSPINKSNSSDGGNESVKPINVPKLSGPVTMSPVSNGVATGAKLVQVQTPNQNIAYVGTLFKQTNKGKDIVPQKVLLTPVKGKEVSMARLILPRPSTPSPQGVVSGKKLCRSFVVSPVTQTSLIKTNDSTSGKLVQPNIIRQRGVEAKILTSAVIKPATVSKTPVPPGLTLVKSPQLQSPTGEKAPMKVILVKEDKTNKPEIKTNESTAPKSCKLSSVPDNLNIEETSFSEDMNVEDDKEKSEKTAIKSVEAESTDMTKSSHSTENEKVVGDGKSNVQWDDKESSNTPFQSTGERARKRKGSLLSTITGTPKKVLVGDPYENIKLFPGAEDYDPFKIIDWDSQGLGNLPSSTIKVVKNEFDMVELLDCGEQTDKKKSDEIFCCLSCGCYGLISEFYNENYCSIGCRDELIAIQHSIFSKKESDLETFDVCDKKKTHDLAKVSTINNESKSSSKSSDKTTPSASNDVSLLKSGESDVIDLIDDNSSSDSPVKKSFNDESRVTKMKKIITKGYKISRKSDVLKPVTNQTPENNENKCSDSKSKIKLRPRNPGKIHKSSSTEDIVAQDLDMSSSIFDNDKKKSAAQFRWNSYLFETKSSGAWVKLFNNPFPSRPNRFKVGQRLEAVDPEHQSYICLVSVAEVKGYRLKLHFDGYPKEYDFWVNADNPNLFPSEFCSKHKIPLQPPPGVGIKHFDWDSYLSRQNAKPAPQSCFENSSSNLDQVNLFKVDMKLEAVDRKNTFLCCVATVAAVMENRILVHFDSWDDMYDYWVDISSPYIRPVGWCKTANHALTPPNSIKPEDFSWKKYLKETRSIAAPDKAFVLRPPIEFKKNMKIEAVDKRAPHLIRVATVAEVLPYQVKITFDGFPAHFGYWVDDDCLDIHPVGWSSRAGHPLESPPSAEDFNNSSCPTPGCIGQGYYQGTKKEIHRQVKNCPYTTENLGKDPVLSDRLKWSTKSFRRNSDDIINLTEDSADESEDEPEEMKWAWMKIRQDLKKGVKREKGTTDPVVIIRGDSESETEQTPIEASEVKVDQKELPIEIKNEDVNEESVKNEDDCSMKEEKEPFIINEKEPLIIKEKDSSEDLSKKAPKEEKMDLQIVNSTKQDSIENEPEILSNKDVEEQKPIIPLKTNSESLNKSTNYISKDCKTVNIITKQGSLEENNPLYWSIHQVSKFTRPLISCPKDCFLEEEIDGQGLLMLSKNDLLDYLGLSDSDAERVYSNINKLRQKAV